MRVAQVMLQVACRQSVHSVQKVAVLRTMVWKQWHRRAVKQWPNVCRKLPLFMKMVKNMRADVEQRNPVKKEELEYVEQAKKRKNNVWVKLVKVDKPV